MKTFNELKKNLKKDTAGLQRVSIALLADSATQLFAQALKGYGYDRNYSFCLYEPDYNQIDSEVFNAQSGLYQSGCEFVLINLSTEHLLREFQSLPLNLRTDFCQQKMQYLEALVAAISEQMNARIIISNFTAIDESVFGNYRNKTRSSFGYQIRTLNHLLMEFAIDRQNVFICDVLALQERMGYEKIFDPKLYVHADMVYAIEFLPFLAKSFSDIIAAIKGQIHKCVILDLDNTTWGGIIGDDGLEGIQLGSLGIGKAFTELQHWIKQLQERGVIIAICSKNNEDTARAPFIKHPDMVLRPEDISVFVANWETKVDNIHYIRNILNIGFDAMVFLDDNPFEREMVRSSIPGITVPDLPEDPAEYLSYLRTLNLFETASFTAEDGERTRQYQEEARRTVLQKSFADEETFLKSLNMQADARPIDNFSLPRVAQLTQRSNQFNLRTVRYTEEDIARLIASPEYFSLTFSLQDQLGSYGLIAVVILKASDASTLFIDTWIMSCRVLKRGMEQFTLNEIVSVAKQHGFKKITGDYLPTSKNALVQNLYADLGFRSTEGLWVLDVNEFKAKKHYIKTITETAQ